MNHETDRELRALFERLRADDLAAVPDFASLTAPDALKRLRRHRRASQVVGAAAGASLALAGTLLWSGRSASVKGPGITVDLDLDLGAVSWRAPSDFLLDTPGRELLRTLPSFTTSLAPALRQPGATAQPERRSDS